MTKCSAWKSFEIRLLIFECILQDHCKKFIPYKTLPDNKFARFLWESFKMFNAWKNLARIMIFPHLGNLPVLMLVIFTAYLIYLFVHRHTVKYFRKKIAILYLQNSFWIASKLKLMSRTAVPLRFWLCFVVKILKISFCWCVSLLYPKLHNISCTGQTSQPGSICSPVVDDGHCWSSFFYYDVRIRVHFNRMFS